MKVNRFRWTHHVVLDRLDRMPAGVDRNQVAQAAEEKLRSDEHELWYEWDEREGRGLCKNLLVEAVTGTWVLFRMTEDDTAQAVSILTEQQYRANRVNLWSRTPVSGPRARTAGPTRLEPLTHNPFKKLAR